MIIAARTVFDHWLECWRVYVLACSDGKSVNWRKAPPVARDGAFFAIASRNREELEDTCRLMNEQAALQIDALASDEQRVSLRLKAEKALQAASRLAEEEGLMLAQAQARKARSVFNEADLVLSAKAEEYRDLIVEKLREHAYVKIISVRRNSRHLIVVRLEDGSWSDPMWANPKLLVACYRARIANGFDLSSLSHWGKTKAKIRQILLPRAAQLLQLEGVKRLLADALARGQRAVVMGSFVFWYESFNNVGWLVKERAADGAGGDADAVWREGKIVSKNHGRIVVLPYTKDNGENVNGHTKNSAHDGKAKPRHPDDVVEIPFEELKGDLMISLFGELQYE